MYAHLGRDPWSKRALIEPRPHLASWIARMTSPALADAATLGVTDDDTLPPTLDPVFRSMSAELVPMLEGIAREVRVALSGGSRRPLPRGLGEVEFPLGEGRLRRAALPYTMWMLQRMRDDLATRSAADQETVRTWLRTLGADRLLTIELPRIRRAGLSIAAAPAGAPR